MKVLKNEHGAALVVVIVAMLVLAIFGATLVIINDAEARSVARQQHQKQAYYLAWSGANTMANYITTNPDNILNMGQYVNQLVAAGTSNDFTVDGNRKFKVNVIRNGSQIEIRSMGRSGDTEKTATVVLNENSGWAFPEFDSAIFAEDKIVLEKAIVKGNVGTNSNAAGSIEVQHNNGKIEGNIMVGPSANINTALSLAKPTNWDSSTYTLSKLTEPRSHPMPPIPDFPEGTSLGNLIRNNSETVTISGNTRYDNIQFGNSAVLNITVNGDTTLRVSNLSLLNGAKINLVGTGNLTFYVENTFSIGNNCEINKNGSAADLFMYYKGTSALTFPNNSFFNGSLYAETASITIDNGNNFTGNVITGGTQLTINNNTSANVRLLYAPNAAITLLNNVVFKGAVIGKSVLIENNATAEYDLTVQDNVTLPNTASVHYTFNAWK